MAQLLKLEEIKPLVNIKELIATIEQGFVLYSNGRTEVPPVGFLHFNQPPGDVHIKYGYIHDDNYYVLKVASAFSQNANSGVPVNNGVVMVFSSQTGSVEYVLMDEGWLTDMRTAAAGAVAAKYLARPSSETIGIVGTGVQARLQLELLTEVVECSRCVVWGRDSTRVRRMIDELEQNQIIRDSGLEISAATDLDSLVSGSDIIVTTTSARAPLIKAGLVKPGTHITAVGSDDHGKQELDSRLPGIADLVVADSKSQCIDHGECCAAIRDKKIIESAIVELGEVIDNPDIGRTNDGQITIADLTGVAVQDIQIAKIVAEKHTASLRASV